MARKESPKKYSAVPPAAPAAPVAEKSTPVNGGIHATEAKPTASTAVVKAVPTQAVPVQAVATQATAAATPKPADRAKATALIAALRDGDADVACDAATALGKLADKSAVEPLIEVLTDTQGYFHSVVRAAAASSLAELGDVRAVEPLLKAIGDPMAEASAEAVRALATLGDRRAVSALVEVVRNASGFYLEIVRRAAVLALAKLGGEAAMTELRAVAANTWEDQVVRDAAIHATEHCSADKKAH